MYVASDAVCGLSYCLYPCSGHYSVQLFRYQSPRDVDRELLLSCGALNWKQVVEKKHDLDQLLEELARR